MSYHTPQQIVEKINIATANRLKTPISKTFVAALLGGAYIAFGSFLALIIGGNLPGIQAENIGLQKLIFGSVFPLGLMLVAIAGAELFTGNTAYFAPSVLSGKISPLTPFKNGSIVYIGNFIGAIIVSWLFAYYTGMLKDSYAMQNAIAIGEYKVSKPFLITLVKGIVCNWMVALAMWMAYAAKDISGKIIGIWFPIMAFVAMGFEHCVANMFFIPTAIFYGADVTWYQFFIHNLLPVTIGNIIGGGLLVGTAYWYLYEKKD
ncbi:formate/nitrite transporter family protein [Flavobacteriaceae bacterium Ap0902]|nr:formate/nitrite transporter family protein [Flavobacteriaceae bacterium Ap0902]